MLFACSLPHKDFNFHRGCSARSLARGLPSDRRHQKITVASPRSAQGSPQPWAPLSLGSLQGKGWNSEELGPHAGERVTLSPSWFANDHRSAPGSLARETYALGAMGPGRPALALLLSQTTSKSTVVLAVALPPHGLTHSLYKCFLSLTGEVWSRTPRLSVLHAAHQKRDCEL